MSHGYLILVLHAHLPYVIGHGRWPHGVEWLYEAACETYIPILNLLKGAAYRGMRAGLTVGLTPVLCEMLASDAFKTGLKEYIRNRIGAAMKDHLRFRATDDPEKAELAHGWALFYESSLVDFIDTYGEDLLEAFRGFQDSGQIEIITSSATHAYLPLIGRESSISAQIRQGVESYQSFFASKSKGIWLPECGYRPASSLSFLSPSNGHSDYRKGIEEILADNEIDYFFLDTHLIEAGEPIVEGESGIPEIGLSSYGSWLSIPDDSCPEDMCYCPSTNLLERPNRAGQPKDNSTKRACGKAESLAPFFAGSPFSDKVCTFFVRDQTLSRQVWSQDHGYPGDTDYLEFHKKDSTSGLRYWKVTNRQIDLGGKETYRPFAASAKMKTHARHFVSLVSLQLKDHYEKTGRPGVVTAPFDAELFGHWWFEGVTWLKTVVELMSKDDAIQLAPPREILKIVRPRETLLLPEGSWGEGGCHTMWYNKETAWMWESIHKAEQLMQEALNKGRSEDPISGRILRQMGRELFLLQASDWEFLVTTKTAREYAESRFRGHEENFYSLREILERTGKDAALDAKSMEKLDALEQKDRVFESIKLSWFEERTDNGL